MERPLNHLRKRLGVADVEVDGRKADPGNDIDAAKLLENEFAHAARADFALARSGHFALDCVDRGVDALRRDRALSERKRHGASQLLAAVFRAAASLLHNPGHGEQNALERREALAAALALAPATDHKSGLRRAGIHNARLIVLTERTTH